MASSYLHHHLSTAALRRDSASVSARRHLSPSPLQFTISSPASRALTLRHGAYRITQASVHVVDDRIVEKQQDEKTRVLRVGVICGGPSAERGISLNSARSVIDHIQVPFYFYLKLHIYDRL